MSEFSAHEPTYYAIHGHIVRTDELQETADAHGAVTIPKCVANYKQCGLSKSAVAKLLSLLPLAMTHEEQSAFMDALETSGVAFLGKWDAVFYYIYAEAE